MVFESNVITLGDIDNFPEKSHIQNMKAFVVDSHDCLDSDNQGVDVCLNVYDVSQANAIHTINNVFALTESPLKFGGIFHVGVEIFNAEWKYGFNGIGSGVHRGLPRVDFQHRFKQQIRLPKTLLTPDKIAKVIQELQVEFWGKDYDLIEKNCCHFANELCQRLGCGSIPAWVHRGANICQNLRIAARSLSLGEFPVEWLASTASCNSETRATSGDHNHVRRTCLI